jgi:hypothetical protein
MILLFAKAAAYMRRVQATATSWLSYLGLGLTTEEQRLDVGMTVHIQQPTFARRIELRLDQKEPTPTLK